MSKYIITTVVTTVMGTVIGWLLNAVKTNTGQLYNMSRREHEERVQNRAMLGELLLHQVAADGAAITLKRGGAQALLFVVHVLGGCIGKQHF